MKKRLSVVAGLVMLMLMGLGIGSAMAAMAAPDFEVTESSVYHDDGFGDTYYILSFAVNNSLDDIKEFAIGNNSANWAEVDGGSSQSSYLTKGLVAFKDPANGWYVKEPGASARRYLGWLDGISEFESYNSAFLFTSWSDATGAYAGSLETGFTNGYKGQANAPNSPFAAYNGSIVVSTGETSAVPIPGAVWLMGSGLVALAAVRRRRKS